MSSSSTLTLTTSSSSSSSSSEPSKPRPKKILISGAGLSGPCLASLLHLAGGPERFECTIAEKSPSFRSAGQQVDIAGNGLKVIRHMGLEAQCRAKRVLDRGACLVDSRNSVIARFPASSADGDGNGDEGFSIVRELEILRPDLAKVLFGDTQGFVKYWFGEWIESLEEDEDGVVVGPGGERKGQKERFDLVVAADGLRSETRKLAFGSGSDAVVVKKLDMFAYYFFVPWTESDGDWTRWHNAPGGRNVTLRPNRALGLTGAYLCQITDQSSRLSRLAFEEQRREIDAIFKQVEWKECARVLHHLKTLGPGDVYMQDVAQAKTDRLVSPRGRVVLLGDAGYCPSPVSGQGTTLALVGSYILAGCLATFDNVEEALGEYERQVRPFVEKSQKLMPGVPWIVNPQTKTGIAVLNLVARFIANLAIPVVAAFPLKKVAHWLPSLASKDLVLPQYPLMPPAKV